MKIISEKEAKAKGLNKYYTGRPCVRGHDSQRWVNGSCVQCGKERDKGRCRKPKTEEQAERLREKTRRWRRNNRERARELGRETMKRMYQNPEYREKVLAQKRSPEQREKTNKRERDRYNSNENAKLARVLRNRVRAAIKGDKYGSCIEHLGCSIEDAISHIESQFSQGMSWDNHGEWHIDHIKPLSWFDLSDPEQFAEACHYTNLQPLWAADNISKGNRYDMRVSG